MNKARSRRVSVPSDAMLAAAVQMRDILLEECHSKSALDPFEPDLNLDFHVELTVSIGEIKAFATAVTVADDAMKRRRAAAGQCALHGGRCRPQCHYIPHECEHNTANAEGQGCRASRHTLDPLVGRSDSPGGAE